MPKGSNARNMQTVTFAEVIEKIRSVRRSTLFISFRYKNLDNEDVHVKRVKGSSLYKDWYGECDFCPANDTMIRHLQIHMDTTCTTLYVSDEVKFEHLMDMIEEVTSGHEPESK